MSGAVETVPVTDTSTQLQRPSSVILYNDDIHTFDEVARQVRKATGCAESDAWQITMTAHNDGKAVAYTGPFERCEVVASVLREIKLGVSIERP